MRRHREECAECEGPLGEAYFDFWEHGKICSDCVHEWIDRGSSAPKWFKRIVLEDLEDGYRRIAPEWEWE